jgi:hypothetical protein
MCDAGGNVTTELIEMTSKTAIVDEFLEKHGAGLPGHMVDFALDVRSAIAELEAELDRVPAGAI